MKKKIEIGQKSKVNIKWSVKPVDYSNDAENSIIAKFADKYGIPKSNITVEPVFIRKNDNGSTEHITDSMIGNVQDPLFQQELFRKYISDNEISGIDFDKIIEIDNEINSEIDYDLYDKRRRYSVKWIKWSNFMSYGPDNYFDFTTLKGLVLLTSEPANQGGKSTFCFDLLRFLLFGKVTSREGDWTLSKVFNKHIPSAREVAVEGCVAIDGTDYVIRRVVTRPDIKKRTDKSKVVQKVSYYKLVNDEYIDLEDEENIEGDTTTETNKLIKEAIGNEKDFDLMICVSSDNLKELISLKDTERGRLVSRWIGLLPLEEKDKLARDRFNTVIMKSLMSGRYNKEELLIKMKGLAQENKEYERINNGLESKKDVCVKNIEEYNQTRDTLMQSKSKIDDNLMKVDVSTIENKMKTIVEQGKIKRAVREENDRKLKELGNVEFDESEYEKVDREYIDKTTLLTELRSKAKHIKGEIETLKKGEYCPTCGARLKDVDNSDKIKAKTDEFNELVGRGKQCSADIDIMVKKREELSKKRTDYNEKLKTQLLIDKIDVDIENLIASHKEYKRTLKDIESNKAAIESNNKIDTSLNIVNEKIKTENNILKGIVDQINSNNSEISSNKKTVKECESIVKVLEKEEAIVRNWKVYLEMVGKNGISKMVLRNVLPFINGELKSILNGVCDFYVEVGIDDRNDVAFYLIHDGVRSGLGSGSGFEQTVASLALRSVLSKISSFSKPSFVVFDEILGGVADENYDQVKMLYDKIKGDYDFILQISHLKSLFEWHSHIIKITKKDNISVIEKV